jgi:hypothetical protein
MFSAPRVPAFQQQLPPPPHFYASQAQTDEEETTQLSPFGNPKCAANSASSSFGVPSAAAFLLSSTGGTMPRGAKVEAFLQSMKRSGSDLVDYPAPPTTMAEEEEEEEEEEDEEAAANGSNENSNDSLDELPANYPSNRRWILDMKK